MGHAVAPGGRCKGLQKVLADEAADETRGTDENDETEPLNRQADESGPSFGTAEGQSGPGFSTVLAQ